MSKIATLRQSAAESLRSESERLQTLNGQMERMPEQMAQSILPLARSLASLSQEVRQVLGASAKQQQESAKALTEALASIRMTQRQMVATSEGFTTKARDVGQVQSERIVELTSTVGSLRMSLDRLWIVAVASPILSAALTAAVLWLMFKR